MPISNRIIDISYHNWYNCFVQSGFLKGPSSMRYLADALSLLRALAIVPLVVLSAMGDWHNAFLVLAVAWATDLVDGFVARRYGTVFKPEFDIDGKADSVLAFGSTLVPVVYAYNNYSMTVVVGLTVLYALTVIVGIAMVSVMNKPLTPTNRWLIAGNMIVLHSVVQIGATLVWFDYMASGAEMAIRFTFALVLIAAVNYRKIRLWWNGQFRPAEAK
jgi:phosphatidylglycerophosphate synthase